MMQQVLAVNVDVEDTQIHSDYLTILVKKKCEVQLSRINLIPDTVGRYINKIRCTLDQ